MKIACAAFALLLAAFPAFAQNVKITPIGSHPGELCANDRAIVFEDPTGVRFLYDVGPTVTGGNDPRLGTIHLVLLTHMHGDHVGDLKLKAPGEGTCANSTRVPAPNSTTAEVVAAKNAVIVTTRAMAAFVHHKVDAIHGSGSKGMDFCPTLAVTVPVPAACSSRIDMGGVFTARADGARQGVEFTMVYSAHVNDLIGPASVIFTHVNEAATEGGKLKANTQTAALMKQVKAPAYLAISERTMQFDGKGKCVSGC